MRKHQVAMTSNAQSKQLISNHVILLTADSLALQQSGIATGLGQPIQAMDCFPTFWAALSLLFAAIDT